MKELNNLIERTLSKNTSVGLFLLLACVLTYVNSFSNGFLIDDNSVLFGQYGVIHRTFLQIFTSQQNGFYRPVGHVFLWVFSQCFGQNYYLYHAGNLALFFAIDMLVYLFVRRLSSNNFLSFLTALFFAAHPINGMLVNYITASVISTFVLCSLLTVFFYLEYLENARQLNKIFSCVFFVLALFSHEMAIMLPVYLMAYLYLIKKESLKKIIAQMLPYILLTIIFFGYFIFYIQKDNLLGGTDAVRGSFQGFFVTWIQMLGWYLQKLFLPVNIIFLWSQQFNHDHFISKLLLSFGLAGAAVYLIFLKWRGDLKSFALALFILGFIPSLSTCFAHFPYIYPYIEPHWFYFSSIGFFVLIAYAFLWLINKVNLRLGMIVVTGLVVLLIILSVSQNTLWQTQERYCRYWLSLNQGNTTPFTWLGHTMLERGDYEGALKVFKTSNRTLKHPDITIFSDMGYCYLQLGKDKSALNLFDHALKEDSSSSILYHYYGLYYLKHNDINTAMKYFLRSINFDPKGSYSLPYYARLKDPNS